MYDKIDYYCKLYNTASAVKLKKLGSIHIEIYTGAFRTDGSKSTGRKVGFVAVFADIIRRGALPEEASIYTAEMTTIKIAMREDMR